MYRVDERRGRNIRAARESLGMSQAELAVALGYETTRVIKRAEAGPWPYHMGKYYGILHVLQLRNPTSLDWEPGQFDNYLAERRREEQLEKARAVQTEREKWLAETIESRKRPGLWARIRARFHRERRAGKAWASEGLRSFQTPKGVEKS